MQTNTPIVEGVTNNPGGDAPPLEDWAAVAHAITHRMIVLGWGQRELARYSHVSRETVREIQLHLTERRRYASTLRALSIALGWHSDHLAAILRGQSPPPPPEPEGTNTADSLADQAEDQHRNQVMPVYAVCTLYPEVSIKPYLDQHEAMVGLRFGTFETTEIRLEFFEINDLQRLSRTVDEAIHLLEKGRTYLDSLDGSESVEH